MSVVVAQRLGSCGAQAYLSHRLEFDPVSHALVGGFLTVGPPGTSLLLLKKKTKQKHILSHNQTTHAKQHIGS